ncbi:MAG TPA: VWA domain-containing protein [Spirochaetia bacterium]|nr:VWA domain-containing protein [Spirochaetia bacterium]
MSFGFQAPYMFLLLALIPFLLYFDLARKKRSALRFSSTRMLSSIRRSRRERFLRVPPVLRCLALLMLVIAIARPMSGRNAIRNVTEGVAIQMVIDRSGSMGMTMDYRGKSVSRFDAVKAVFSDFVLGNGRELSGRPNDLIGVTAFAGFADTISPLTNSREAMAGILKELEIISDASKDGTAIGDAIALGAARLKTAEEEAQFAGHQGDIFKIKSKIMIILTDGEQNAGERTPAQAAALAKEWGIKLYTIGVASAAGGGFSDFSGAILGQIAESTGGIFRIAADERSLRAVYEEIDRLEKTEVESIQYLIVREYFLPFALAAFGMLILEALLSVTLLRRLP